MKKLVPFLIAGALALPVVGVAAHHASAQDRSHDCGAHEGGPGHHGGRGHHGPRGGNPAEFAEHRTRMLTAILDLDAHQQSEVRRLLTAEATEMQTIMQQPRSEARHTAMRALHERTKDAIDALLNPTQRATMDRIEAARREGHDRH